MEPDRFTRQLLELYLRPLGFTLHCFPSIDALLAAPRLPQDALALVSLHALSGTAPETADRVARALNGMPIYGLALPGEAESAADALLPFAGTLPKPIAAPGLLAACGISPAPGPSAHPPAAPDNPASPGGDEAPLAGFKAMVAELGLDPELVGELTRSFTERCQGYLEELEQALRTDDREALERIGHALKGMCGNLRLLPLVEACDRLRAEARGGQMDKAAEVSALLRTLLEQACALVEKDRQDWD
jgi:HPt (histidine-containing phosphotransfer) domain-containing protein